MTCISTVPITYILLLQESSEEVREQTASSLHPCEPVLKRIPQIDQQALRSPLLRVNWKWMCEQRKREHTGHILKPLEDVMRHDWLDRTSAVKHGNYTCRKNYRCRKATKPKPSLSTGNSPILYARTPQLLHASKVEQTEQSTQGKCNSGFSPSCSLLW